jgi:hypothetical protein
MLCLALQKAAERMIGLMKKMLCKEHFVLKPDGKRLL